ncbi:MAG: hypothetical protein JWQ95_3376 [Sphaerisporangium sp.]|jgi:hypothetical protein|nr:hypothetical protein [Sphaerisporangium sp.]
MSSAPKSNKSLLRELFEAVSKLSSAVSSGVVGRPTSPGPVVDIRHGKDAPNPLRRRH